MEIESGNRRDRADYRAEYRVGRDRVEIESGNRRDYRADSRDYRDQR